jgi:hypothetical protein
MCKIAQNFQAKNDVIEIFIYRLTDYADRFNTLIFN